MFGKRDEQALDWYNGRQSVVRRQSVLHERHIYLDTEEKAAYRACWLLGMESRPRNIFLETRTGGMGIIDTATGMVVIHVTDCTEFPRQTEPLALEIASLARGERERKEVKTRGQLHQVTIGKCHYTGETEVELHDINRKRHGEGGYRICRIPVDPGDETAIMAAETLLAGFARELDGHPLDWTAMRRRPKATGAHNRAVEAAT